MSRREDAKQETRRRLLTAAREVVAHQGAAALSLREVARRAGVVPSAVYRHVENRDALLSELLVESYRSLADALEAVCSSGWAATAGALRAWALERPHEFQLLYGTPVPGYSAPERTVPEAARIARAFLQARLVGDRAGGAGAPESVPAGTSPPGKDQAALPTQLLTPAAQLDTDPVILAVVLADLAQLVGLLLLEAGGHFVGTADPADHLWDAVVARQCDR